MWIGIGQGLLWYLDISFRINSNNSKTFIFIILTQLVKGGPNPNKNWNGIRAIRWQNYKAHFFTEGKIKQDQ